MNVFRIRKDWGLTQVQLAALLGVHPITVSKWEHRLAKPSPYQAAILLAMDESDRPAPDKQNLAAYMARFGVPAALGVVLSPLANKF